MTVAPSLIDRLQVTLGVPRRTLEDTIDRLRTAPDLMRPNKRGRRLTFTPPEIVSLFLAIGAGPAPNRKGLNVVDRVRAARAAVRYTPWEDGDNVPKNFYEGTKFAPEATVLGPILDSIFGGMVDGSWPMEYMTARLRFDHGGGKILLVVEKYPPGWRNVPVGPSPPKVVSAAMVFHARPLLDAWTASCFETTTFMDKAAFEFIAEAMRAPP